jgi:Ran GTPase-activating protein (RanGAP) involved in mRNA processing and transport
LIGIWVTTYVPDDTTFRELFQLGTFYRAFVVEISESRCHTIAQEDIPYAKRLKVMDLRGNLIGDEGVAELVQCISRTNIKSLKLGFNRITDIGAKHLAWLVMQPNCQLTHLDLNCNFIGNNGGRAAPRLSRTTKV